MFQRILVPLDGSVRAEYAIPVATHLARRYSGSIVFVRIVLPASEHKTSGVAGIVAVSPGASEKRLVEAEHYLHQVIHRHADNLVGIPVELEVQTGAPSSSLFSVAQLEQVDLIVLCSHGTHDLFHYWVFNSIAKAALHRSPVPILVLKETEGAGLALHLRQPMRMLVALDGSLFSEEVLQPALQLVCALSAPVPGEIHLLRVVPFSSVEGTTSIRARVMKRMQEKALLEAEDYLQKIAHRLAEQAPGEIAPLITWSTTVNSRVARTIAHTAEAYEEREPEDDYDVLALATHGRSGLQRLLLGSVTEHVLSTTHLPLLIVRPQPQLNRPEQTIATKVEA